MELYELVQHAGNVLPRLYLLVCVGSVYVESGEGKAKDVLRDVAEIGEGVPTSGARIVSESVFGADGESERTVARYRERIGKERRRDRGGFHRVYFE